MLKTLRRKIIARKASMLFLCGLLAVAVMLGGCGSSDNSDDNGNAGSSNEAGDTDSNGGNSNDGSTDGTTDGGNESDGNKELNKVPTYEKLADGLCNITDIGTTGTKDNYGYGDKEYTTGISGAYTNITGTLKWGEYYSPKEYKPFVAYKQWEKPEFSFYGEFYVNSPTVTDPYSDKNVMFIRSDRDYHIEIPDTGDVTMCFLAADEVTLICLSKTAVKAYNTEDASKLWEVSPDSGAYFASTYKGINTDWNKMIIDMYTETDGKYEYYDSMVIDFKDGSSKKLKVSGLYSDNERVTVIEALTADNVFVSSEWEICGDKYMGIIGIGRHGADVWVIVDDNGEILMSTDIYEGTVLPVKDDDDWKEQYYVDEAYVLGTGHFVIYIKSGSLSDDRTCVILDNNLDVVKEFDSTRLDEMTSTMFKLGESQTIFAGDNSYGSTGSHELGYSQVSQMHLTFDKDLNVIPGFNTDLFGYNGYIFSQYYTYPEGTEFRYDAINNVFNIYTGKTLEGYGLVELNNGMPGSQGDVAFVKDNTAYSFIDSDLNQLYVVPSEEGVTEWANYEGSKYLAYVTTKGAVYGINKSTKEVVKIKDADEESAGDYDIMVNGDFVIYTAGNNCTELHAYNMETGEDSIIFKAESETDRVKVSEDKRQNNWFYVCTDYNAEDKKYESYEAYALK